jgi:hypothetical protein
MPELLLQADIARIFVILSLGGTFRRILIGSILWHSMNLAYQSYKPTLSLELSNEYRCKVGELRRRIGI